LAVVGVVLMAAVLAMGQAKPPASRPATTATASSPASASASAPARLNSAFTPLDKLLPAVAAPKNTAGADDLPERAADDVKAAEEQIAQKRYDSAISTLESARRFDVENPRILRDLGLAYAGMGDWAKAGPVLRGAAKTAPNSLRVQLLLGEYCFRVRQLEPAILQLRQALLCNDATPANPETGEATLMLAGVLERQGYYTAALEAYTKFEKLSANAEREYLDRPRLKAWVEQPELLLAARGRVLLAMDRKAEGADLLERAYRRNKDSAPGGEVDAVGGMPVLTSGPEAARLAIRALVAAGNNDRARGLVLEMLREPKLRSDAYSIAIDYVRQSKDADSALKLLEARSDPEFAVQMALLSAELGKPDVARQILKDRLPTLPAEGRSALALARLYAQIGEFDGAMRQFGALLKGRSVEAWQVRRELAPLLRSPKTAENLKKLIDATRAGDAADKAAVLTVAGILTDAAGDSAAAGDLLEDALKADPAFAAAAEELERIYAETGQNDKLDALAKRVEATGGDTHFRYFLLGKIQMDRGKFADAVETLSKAQARDNNHVMTVILLAKAHLAAAVGQLQGDASAAAANRADGERLLLAAYEMDQDNLNAATELATWLLRRGDRERAFALLGRFVQQHPQDLSGRVAQGQLYLSAGQLEPLRKALPGLLGEAPQDPAVLMLDLQASLPRDIASADPLTADQAAAALDKAAKILALDPGNLDVRIVQASILLNQKRYAEAATAYAALAKRRPKNAAVARAYLDALDKAGQQDQAAAFIEQAAPNAEDALLRGVMLASLTGMKRYELAETIVDRWLTATSDELPLYRLRLQAVDIYRNTKHYDKGQKLLDEWIAGAGEQSGLLRLLRGEKLRLYAAAGATEETLRYARKWVGNEDDAGRARLMVVQTLVAEKAYAIAGTLLDEWLPQESDPKRAALLRYQKFDVLAEQEKFDEALKLAEQWAAEQAKAPAPADDKAIDARRLVIDALSRAGKHDEAIRRGEAYAKEKPDDIKNLRLKYLALTLAGKDDDVLPLLDAMIKLKPDDPSLNNDMGYFLADKGIRLDEAETMVRKALAAEPDSASVADSFAWVLYKQGRFAEAKRIFEQVLAQPKDELHAIIYLHAADNLYRAGEKERAAAMWKQSQEMAKAADKKDPGGDNAKALAGTAERLKAVEAGKVPPLSPLGKGVEPK
jgi:tetratricopeptide (TPR) repeat protein